MAKEVVSSGSQPSLIKSPEDVGCCDADGGHEGIRASIVTVRMRRQSLSLPNIFDLVPFAIENAVMLIGFARLDLMGCRP